MKPPYFALRCKVQTDNDNETREREKKEEIKNWRKLIPNFNIAKNKDAMLCLALSLESTILRNPFA